MTELNSSITPPELHWDILKKVQSDESFVLAPKRQMYLLWLKAWVILKLGY